jgi:hypothetical protein
MFAVMQRKFGFRLGLYCQASIFSLVTVPEPVLAPLQRMPHYDYSLGESGSGDEKSISCQAAGSG